MHAAEKSGVGDEAKSVCKREVRLTIIKAEAKRVK